MAHKAISKTLAIVLNVRRGIGAFEWGGVRWCEFYGNGIITLSAVRRVCHRAARRNFGRLAGRDCSSPDMYAKLHCLLAICRNKHTLWETESIIFHKESIFITVYIAGCVRAWFTICWLVNSKQMNSSFKEERNSWHHHNSLNKY